MFVCKDLDVMLVRLVTNWLQIGYKLVAFVKPDGSGPGHGKEEHKNSNHLLILLLCTTCLTKHSNNTNNNNISLK